MITEILNNAETLILLYAPMVMTVISTLVNFIAIFKKLKTIKVKEDMNEALTGTNEDIKELIAQTKIIHQENEMLRQKLNKVIENITKIEVTDDEIKKD